MLEGRRVAGHGLQIGYFAQHQVEQLRGPEQHVRDRDQRGALVDGVEQRGLAAAESVFELVDAETERDTGTRGPT